MQSAECRKAGQSHSKVGFGATRSAARQSRNRSLEGLAAEHVHVRIRALPPERRIYAAVGRKTRPLPHKCGVPAHGSPESGGSARMRPASTFRSAATEDGRKTQKTDFLPLRLPRIRRIPRFTSCWRIFSVCEQSRLLQWSTEPATPCTHRPEVCPAPESFRRGNAAGKQFG